MASLAIAPDTFVTLSYVMFDEHGERVEATSDKEPLTYVHGYAQLVPGLERSLVGLVAGDHRQITVEAGDGFGERDDAGIFEVDRADFPQSGEVSPGDEFMAEGPDGDAIAMRIVEVRPDAFVVDTNHPLAGQRIRFDLTVADVRAATEEEISQAQADLEDALEHVGCSHGDHEHHDHDHHDHSHHPTHADDASHASAAVPLVQMSRKK